MVELACVKEEIPDETRASMEEDSDGYGADVRKLMDGRIGAQALRSITHLARQLNKYVISMITTKERAV